MAQGRPAAETPGSCAGPAGEAGAHAARCVEVAVDVAGAAAERTYTYRVPRALADLAAGEAVLVEFGRRQALGVVLGDAAPPGDVAPKPVLARVRSDGPLLPLLQLQLVRAVARRYLAPPALVARAALPPGLLERLELVAVGAPEAAPDALTAARRSGGSTDHSDSASRRALEVVCARVAAAGPGGVPVRSLPWRGGRAALLRELRLIEAAGGLRLEWRISAPSAAPRVERRVGLTRAGWEMVRRLGGEPSGPRRSPTRLGPRQRAVLVALAALPDGETAPAAPLAEVHGTGPLVSLARRGLVELTIAEHPRRPLAGRAPGPRGAAPVDARLSGAQRDAVAAIVGAIVARRAVPFLLDGVTGAGRTAVYAAAIGAALAAGRSALVLVPEIALAVPLVDRLRAELGVEVALLHGGLSEGERADEWRRIRDGAVAVVVGTRSAVFAPLADPGVVIVDEEHDAAYKSDRTPRYQARDVALELGSLAAAPVVLGSATPEVVVSSPALRCPNGRPGRCPRSRWSTCASSSRRATTDSSRGRSSRRSPRSTAAPVNARSWSSTVAGPRVWCSVVTAGTCRSVLSASGRSSITPLPPHCAAITAGRARRSPAGVRPAARPASAT
jgi:primosomal protein N' (replication factor Y)